MSFAEWKYYWFGLTAGMRNVRHNGVRLGWKKTVGKITQPVNSYTRFPEYYLFEDLIRKFHEKVSPSKKNLRILDIGSPKLFGLYLAHQFPFDLCLTDIHETFLTEYRPMWESMRYDAKGTAEFERQDARKLTFRDGSFDVVYSMSVVEHIEGNDGDRLAVGEMQRVNTPGGLFMLSVPFGSHYMVQTILRDRAYTAENTLAEDAEAFFQRIYDIQSLRERICRALRFEPVLLPIIRQPNALVRLFLRLPENLRGLLGVLNPFLSVLANRHGRLDQAPLSEYGPSHHVWDYYGDMILSNSQSI